jgi:phage/plasmid-associated DNA primase
LRVRLDGDGGAWRRRLIILRFKQPPPKKRIPNFAEKLVVEEGAGILRWALAGLLRARQELAATGDLILTPPQQSRIDALLSESDSIRRFVAECTARGEGNVTSHELVEAYFHFCASNEWTPQPVRIVERTLADVILETHGASRAQDIGRGGKSVRGWRNVILITEAENVAA